MTPLGAGQLGGKLEISTCKTDSLNMLNMTSPSRWSTLGLAMGCKTVQGNSGSPVLNDKNEVVGILQAYTTDGFRQILKKAFSQFNLVVPDNIPNHGLFSNMSCIKDPVTKTYNEEQCKFWKDKHIMSCLKSDNEQNTESLNQINEAWINQLPEVFVYNFIHDIKTSMNTANPICLKTRDQLNNYDEYVKLKGLIGLRKEKLSISFDQVMKVGVQFNIDDNFSLSESLNLTTEFSGNYTVNLTKEGDRWVGHHHINSQNALLSNSGINDIKFPMDIPDCTDENITSYETSPEQHKFVLVDGNQILESEFTASNMEPEALNCEE